MLVKKGHSCRETEDVRGGREVRHSLRASRLVFEQCLEPPQAFIPFGADFLDPLINIAEGFRGQGIAFFAPLLMDSNQSCIFENVKMLEYPLPCDGIFFCKLGRCLRAVFRQIHQQAQDGCSLRRARGGSVAT